MSLASKLLSVAGSSGVAATTYVDDVFSAFTYTGSSTPGNSSPYGNIVNGVDLATKGGLVWTKCRTSNASGTNDHVLVDSTRRFSGSPQVLKTNTAAAQFIGSDMISTFNSNGYTLTGGNTGPDAINTAGNNYTSWTFAKAPKFFDVVTYTGNGANRTISHSLGGVPGMIVVKRTDTTSEWKVYHNSIANTEYLALNTTAAKATDATLWNSTTATSSVFSLGTNVDVNANAGTYVAYLFAHDTSTTGLIQCGSFTTDASGNATVNLGWEPQFVLCKRINSASVGQWYLNDMSRGFPAKADGGSSATLTAESSGAETISGIVGPTATGFTSGAVAASSPFIYLAIRRPNKPPTTGTQVYNAIARTGTGAAATVTGVGFAPDALFSAARSGYVFVYDRLRGVGAANTALGTPSTNSEVGLGSPNTTVTSFNPDGMSVGSDSAGFGVNTAAPLIHWFFKRAPGFFDEVCYPGTGVAQNVAHNLGVVPELIIFKNRNTAGGYGWYTFSSVLTAPSANVYWNFLQIELTTAAQNWGNNSGLTAWPTSTLISLGTANSLNISTGTNVAYLFATLPGISKVFSYTGNGSSQTIGCGFTTGARFILIKRTDAAGDWFLWDSTRGIVSANDPHLSLNTTAAEVTTDDSVDSDTSGFIVNQVAATNVNVTSATYIGLAIA